MSWTRRRWCSAPSQTSALRHVAAPEYGAYLATTRGQVRGPGLCPIHPGVGATHPVIDDGESWPPPQRRPRQRRPAHGTTVHASPGSTPATALRHPAVGRGAAVRCVYLLRDAHRLLAAVCAARCAEPLLGS